MTKKNAPAALAGANEGNDPTASHYESEGINNMTIIASASASVETDESSPILSSYPVIKEEDGGMTIVIQEGDTTAWLDLEPGAAFWTLQVQAGSGVGHTIGTLQDYVDQARAMIHASTLMLRLNGFGPIA